MIHTYLYATFESTQLDEVKQKCVFQDEMEWTSEVQVLIWCVCIILIIRYIGLSQPLQRSSRSYKSFRINFWGPPSKRPGLFVIPKSIVRRTYHRWRNFFMKSLTTFLEGDKIPQSISQGISLLRRIFDQMKASKACT